MIVRCSRQRCLAVFIAAGCATAAPEPSVIRVVEVRSTSADLPHPRRSITGVDVNSALRIELDPPRPVGIGVATVDAKLGQDQKQLTRLLTQIDSLLELNQRIEEAYRASHDVVGRRLAGVDTARLSNLLDQRGPLGVRMIASARGYVAGSRGLGDPSDPDVRRRANQVLDSLGIGNFGVNFRSYIQAEVTRIEDELKLATNTIINSGARATIRAEARLYKPNGQFTYVHLPGYDTLESGQPRFINKLSFELSESQREALRQDIGFYAELSTAVNQLRREGFNADSVFRIMRRHADAVLAALPPDTLKAILVDGVRPLVAQLSLQQSSLRAIVGSLGDQSVVTLRDRLSSIQQIAESAVTQLRDLQQLGQRAADPAVALIDFPQAALTTGLAAAEQVVAALFPAEGPSILQLFAQIDSSVTRALATFNPATAADSTATTILRNFKTRAGTALQPLSDQRIVVLRELVATAKRLTNPGAAKLAAGVSLDPMGLEIPLESSALPGTELNLIQTERMEGDELKLTVFMRTADGLPSDYTRTFRVLRYGTHSAVGANLMFAWPQRSRNADPVTAPAVTYGVRYRTRETNGWGRFLNLVMPGIGLNLSMLDFGESEFELGAGIGVSLFSGVLEAGAGFNFEENVGYPYLALGILDAIRQIQSRR